VAAKQHPKIHAIMQALEQECGHQRVEEGRQFAVGV